MQSSHHVSFQEMITSSKRNAMLKRSEKHKCEFCGKQDITWSQYSQFNYFLTSYGHKTSYSGLTDFIVCSENCRREYIRSGKVNSKYLIADIDIPKRAKHASLEWWNNPDDEKEMFIYETMTKWLKGDLEKGWFLLGNVGSGKTCLTVSLVRELRKLEKTVRWFDFSDLLIQFSILKRSKGEEFTEEWKKFNSDVIVIDEVRTVSYQDAVAQELFAKLVNDFYTAGKIMILTSNVSAKELENTLNPRTLSRLYEMCLVYPFTHEDYRKINE